MIPQQVLQDINKITTELIKYGLSDAQNFPSITENSGQTLVQHSGFQDISIALKNVCYSEIYNQLEADGQYNIKLLDGGLLQFLYCFENEELVKHRLCYFPSPSFESFQNEPEVYLDDSNIYADVILKSVLPVPVRFDFAPEDSEPLSHPSSHLTLGQYKNCRIPVKSPLCPSTFVNFIIRSFYFNATYDMPAMFESKIFESTIHPDEEKVLHFSIS